MNQLTRKILLLAAFGITGIAAFGQSSDLKINTSAAAANDARVIISASDPNDPAGNEGLIIPRINAFPGNETGFGSAPAANSRGMLVYLQQTFIGDGNAAGYVAGREYAPGFYYWSGTQWLKFTTTADATAAADGPVFRAKNGIIRVADTVMLGGNLTQPTSIANGGNPLNIAGSGSTTTFAPDGRVGIGTTIPAAALDVNGSIRFGAVGPGTSGDSILTINPATGIVNRRPASAFQAPISASNGILKSGDTIKLGGPILQPTTISGINGTNTLTIASSEPLASTPDSTRKALALQGLYDGATGRGGVHLSFNESTGIEVGRVASVQESVPFNVGLGFSTHLTGGTSGSAGTLNEHMRLTGTGNLGVGTKTPAAKLDVNGNVRIGSVATGAAGDSILTINTAGVITKRAASSVQTPIGFSNGIVKTGDTARLGGAITQPTTINNGGYTLNIAGSGSTTTFAPGGNVGLGVAAPAEKLDVAGNVSMSGKMMFPYADGIKVNFIKNDTSSRIIHEFGWNLVTTAGTKASGNTGTFDWRTVNADKTESNKMSLGNQGQFTLSGSLNGFFQQDRTRTGRNAGIYTDGGYTKIWNSLSGDRVFIDSTGRMGLNTVPTADLQLPNTVANKKLSLYDNNNVPANDTNFLGFGVNSQTLRYQVPQGNFHRWFANNTQLMELSGSGNLKLNSNTNGASNQRFINSNAGSNAYNALILENDNSGMLLFENSSTRTADGGASTGTLRNDAGNLRLQAAGAKGITVNKTSGKVVLDDSLQVANIPSGGGTVMITADNNGVIRKQALPVASAPAIFGTANATGVPVTAADGPYKYTGASITIPANSKYIVQVYQLMTPVPEPGIPAVVPAGQSLWVRSTFSTDSVSSINPPLGDVVGSRLISGTISAPMYFNMMSGAIVINNTSSSARTYYYMVGSVASNGFTGTLYNFASTKWGENQIYAVPTN